MSVTSVVLVGLVVMGACDSRSDEDRDARVVDARVVFDSVGAHDAMDAPMDAFGDGSAPICSGGEGAFPRPLNLPNPPPNGVFDPNLARDPASGRMWMAYSGVDGPAGSGLVSTHLAYSDDRGVTWCWGGVANEARIVPEEDQPARIAMSEGHWSHETAAIAYDPGAQSSARWRMIWHRYLHVDDGVAGNEDRRFEYGWISQRTASTAEGLLDAPEENLFSARAYHALVAIETYNDGIVGVPEKRWDQDADLGDCLAFAEPGMVAHQGSLYVSMFCYRDQDHQDVVLVRLNHGSGTWSYVNTLLTTADAKLLSPSSIGFNASDIFMLGGEQRLLVSPVVGSYAGCIEYEVDLATGVVADVGGDGPDPIVAIPKNPDIGVAQTGACAFHEGIATGIILGDTYVGGVQFRLVATGRSP